MTSINDAARIAHLLTVRAEVQQTVFKVAHWKSIGCHVYDNGSDEAQEHTVEEPEHFAGFVAMFQRAKQSECIELWDNGGLHQVILRYLWDTLACVELELIELGFEFPADYADHIRQQWRDAERRYAEDQRRPPQERTRPGLEWPPVVFTSKRKGFPNK